MKKRLGVVISLTLMAFSMGVLLYLALREPAAGPGAAPAPETPAAAQVRIAAPIFTTGPLSKLPPEDQQLAKVLQDRFGGRLEQPYWRIRVIETLIRYLQKRYPGDWRMRLQDLLRRIFPDQADALLRTLEAYDGYNAWLESIHGRVFNSVEERRKAIWDQRVKFFGKDAELIWAQDLKQEKVADALRKLDTSGLPLAAKVDGYVKTLAGVYGPSALDPAQSHPVQLMEGFLTLKSVQSDLQGMSRDQQRQTLRDLRSSLGLKDDAIQRLEELDDKRAQRYSAGETYMAQRKALEQQLKGDALQLQVTALQNRLFGEEEAQFIRNEEAAGYFRYKEKQVIGVN